MRRFGIGAAGLVLLTTAAAAADTNPNPQTLRITSGQTVATVDFSGQPSPQVQSPVKADRIRVANGEWILSGNVRIQMGDTARQALTISADSVTVDIPDHKLKSLTCSGSVVVQVREGGRQKLQIASDNVVVEGPGPR